MTFRDGVGDGQIPYVLEHEINAIQNCFKKAGLPEDIKFTYIIVSKRINTRVLRYDFSSAPVSGCYNSRCRLNGKPTNPPSGTVVDDVVTLPER